MNNLEAFKQQLELVELELKKLDDKNIIQSLTHHYFFEFKKGAKSLDLSSFDSEDFIQLAIYATDFLTSLSNDFQVHKSKIEYPEGFEPGGLIRPVAEPHEKEVILTKNQIDAINHPEYPDNILGKIVLKNKDGKFNQHRKLIEEKFFSPGSISIVPIVDNDIEFISLDELKESLRIEVTLLNLLPRCNKKIFDHQKQRVEEIKQSITKLEDEIG